MTPDDDNLAVIIGVSAAGAVLLVIAISLLIVLGCHVCRRRAADDSHVTGEANFAWETHESVTCTDVAQRTC